MNEVFRRRLIGLAVLLALVFVLSLLLPQDGATPGSPEAPSTTVTLDGETEAPPEAVPAPPSPASLEAGAVEVNEAEEAKPADGPQAPVVDPPPPPSSPPATKPAGDKPATTALRLSPSVSAPAVKSPSASAIPKPAAASPPEAAAAAKPAPKSGVALSPPKPKLAESVGKTPPPTAAVASTTWYVQIGSFADAGTAATILSLLRTIGYQGEVSKIVNGAGATLQRVRLGPFASEAEAKQAQENVTRQGYPEARVVAEGGGSR